MRARRAVLAAAAAGAGALVLSACIDLFHSTDFETLCSDDPDAAACTQTDARVSAGDAADAGAPLGPADFCAWSRDEARANAAHACAWLGACEGPLGANALGTCMIQAILTYDCRVNPNRRPQLEMREYWDCLWRARSCAAVEQCVRPHGALLCSPNGSDYTQCESAANGGDPNTRIACLASAGATDTPAAAVESCVASGQTCARLPAGECNGSASPTCADSGCEGTHLHACDEAGVRDLGVDCRYFGGGACVSTDAGGACLAAEGGACTPSADVGCDGGIATGCPSGITETVDCAALLGAGGCGAVRSDRPWDVASACDLGQPCAADSCASGDVSSCARGATFRAGCAGAGLGPCRMVTLPGDAGSFAACAPP